jgi:hypothetical protein
LLSVPELVVIYSSALPIRQCCAGCRRPLRRCGCETQSAGTYSGVLLRDEWRELRHPELDEDAAELLAA